MTLLNRSLLIAIAAVLACFAYYYLNTQAEFRRLANERDKAIQNAKLEKRKSIDSLRIVMDYETDQLETQITALSEQSNDLIQKLRRYETRPDFDLDFLTAADIVSKSNYRPDK